MAKKKDISLTDVYDVESSESTEFRRVLHNINGSSAGGEKRSILITSAVLSEGKSIISSFLAMTSARLKNRKTLLIDFDLRRPSIHKLFSVDLRNGVTDILTRNVPSRNSIKKTSMDNLDILTAGKVIANPSELLNSPGIHKIIEEMKFYYELILVDSPPLLPVMDPMLLLEELDGVIVVVKAGTTQKDIALRAGDFLASQKEKIVGVIVNNINQALPYHYNYDYYGYRHKPSG